MSEVKGWLYKLGTGHTKSWSRRYFSLEIETCRIIYSKKEFTTSEASGTSNPIQTEFTITHVTEPGSIVRIPRNLKITDGILVFTSNSKRRFICLWAETTADKKRWMKNILISVKNHFAKRRPNHGLYSRTSMHRLLSVIKREKNDKADHEINPIQSTIYANIAIFIGDIQTIGRMSLVSKSWHNSYDSNKNAKLWEWLVLHGAVSNRCRWEFWCYCVRAKEAPIEDEFEALVDTPGTEIERDIKRDVDRTFGHSGNKRMVSRRSICAYSQDERPSESLSTYPNIHTRKFSNESNNSDSDTILSSLTISNTTANTLSIVVSTDEIPASPGPNRWIDRFIPSTPLTPARKVAKGVSFTPPQTAKSSLASSLHSSSQPTPPPPSQEQRGNFTPISKVRVKTLHFFGSNNHTSNSNNNNLEIDNVTDVETSSKVSQEMQSSDSISIDDLKRKKCSLTRILLALAATFPSVGYAQGMDRLVVHAMRAARCTVSTNSLSNVELENRDEIDRCKERKVFSFLVQLFESLNLPEIFASNGVLGLRLRIYQLAELGAMHCPKLFAHVNAEGDGITPEIFGISWLQTLFLCVEAMPASTVDRIWDLLLFESSWLVVFRVSLAIFQLSEEYLLQEDLTGIIDYFNNFHYEEVLDHNVLLRHTQSIIIPTEELNRLEKEFRDQNCV